MPNPISALFKRGFKKDSSILGIDIGSSAIKIVQVKNKAGTAVLETYGELALGPYGDVGIGRAVQLPVNKVVEALQTVIKEANVTTNHAAIAIPLSASLVSLIQMPNLDEKQLAQMIPIEARKYIPVPISEVTLDWMIIPKEVSEPTIDELEMSDDNNSKVKSRVSNAHIPTVEEVLLKDSQSQHDTNPNVNLEQKGKIEVLIVAIHNEALTTYNQIVKQAGLQVRFFEIEIFSAVRAVIAQSKAPFMIFDMGASSTKLFLVENGSVKSSHLISRGSQDLTMTLAKSLGISQEKAEEVKRGVGLNQKINGKNIAEVLPTNLEFLFSETNRVLLAYEKKYNKVVQQIILTGGGSQLPGFVEMARDKFDTEVVFGDPFAKLETPAFLEEMLQSTGPEFAVAIGVAIRALQEGG